MLSTNVKRSEKPMSQWNGYRSGVRSIRVCWPAVSHWCRQHFLFELPRRFADAETMSNVDHGLLQQFDDQYPWWVPSLVHPTRLKFQWQMAQSQRRYLNLDTSAASSPLLLLLPIRPACWWLVHTTVRKYLGKWRPNFIIIIIIIKQ